VAAEVDALVERGARVTVFAAGRATAEPTPPPSASLQVHWLGGRALFGFPGALTRLRQRPSRALALPLVGARYLRALASLERSRGPVTEVVCHWLLPTAWPAGLWASRRGVELTAVAHGSDVRLLESMPRALRLRVVGALHAKGARLRFVSRELRQCLVHALADSPLLAAFAAGAEVRPAALAMPPPLERAEARRRVGVAAPAKVVVLVARLVEGKRLETALSAAALLPGFERLVIGDGPLRPELELLFPEARFLGALDRGQTLEWLAAADVVLSASREEGSPTVVREARLLGTPVVAVACGDVADWAACDPELYVISR
jgi:glycosyltransferase involved in cell wall biosynthesis